MDAIIEILLEVFSEGTFILSKSNKAPKLVRVILLLTILSAVFASYYLAYLMRSHWQIMWTLIVLGSILLWFLTWPLFKHKSN